MTLFKLIVDETIPEGEGYIDKENSIILVHSTEDWFKLLEEYNNE